MEHGVFSSHKHAIRVHFCNCLYAETKRKRCDIFCEKPLLSFGAYVLHEEYHWKQYTFFVNPLKSVSSEGCRKNRSPRTSFFTVIYYINAPLRKVFLSGSFIGIFSLAFVNLDSSCKQEFKTMEILSQWRFYLQAKILSSVWACSRSSEAGVDLSIVMPIWRHSQDLRNFLNKALRIFLLLFDFLT